MASKILIVDDSPTILLQARQALCTAGFEVLEAADGDAAYRQLALHHDIAAMVCDINMPGLNGLDLLDRLRAEGRLPVLPVLMLTTEGHPSLLQRAKAAGARGWMVKPFKAEFLVATVEKLSLRREAQP